MCQQCSKWQGCLNLAFLMLNLALRWAAENWGHVFTHKLLDFLLICHFQYSPKTEFYWSFKAKMVITEKAQFWNYEIFLNGILWFKKCGVTDIQGGPRKNSSLFETAITLDLIELSTWNQNQTKVYLNPHRIANGCKVIPTIECLRQCPFKNNHSPKKSSAIHWDMPQLFVIDDLWFRWSYVNLENPTREIRPFPARICDLILWRFVE